MDPWKKVRDYLAARKAAWCKRVGIVPAHSGTHFAILQLAHGEQILLNESGLEYWDWHPLPYGAVILGDWRNP